MIPATLLLALGASGAAVAQVPGAKNAQPPAMQQRMPNKGRLGLVVLPISGELREKLGAPGDRGVLVDAVRPDSPAARAGVRVGDVITTVDGDAVGSAGDFGAAMMDRAKGQGVALAIVRDGRAVQVTATLDADAAPRGPMSGMAPDTFDMPGSGNGDWRWLEPPGAPGADRAEPPEVKRQLDDTRRRLDALEQRLDKLEQR